MKLSRDLWIALALMVIAISLSAFPFHPLRTAAQIQGVLADFLAYAIEPPILRTLLERVLLLIPVGFFAARHFRRSSLNSQLALVVFGSIAFCLAVEAVQVPVAGRHARSSDALLAITCMMAGYAFSARLYQRSLKRARLIILTAALAPSLLALCAWAVGPSTLNWSLHYPVLLGDEFDGGRPWAGEISGIAIYPEGLGAEQILEMSKRPFDPSQETLRTRSGALWVYSGEDAQGAPAAPLVLPGPTLPPAAQMPQGFGGALARKVKKSNRFAIELRLKAARVQQYGPARIVTNSTSAWLRNFSISQQRSWYDFRFRTLSSGANGTGFELSTHDHAVTGEWQHLVAQYDRGQATIYLDGAVAVGPYAYDRFTRWDGLVFAPILVLMSALGGGFLLLGSTFMPMARWGRL